MRWRITHNEHKRCRLSPLIVGRWSLVSSKEEGFVAMQPPAVTPSDLSVAEALVLQEPNSALGRSALELTMMDLLARRVLTLAHVKTKGRFGMTRKTDQVIVAPDAARQTRRFDFFRRQSYRCGVVPPAPGLRPPARFPAIGEMKRETSHEHTSEPAPQPLFAEELPSDTHKHNPFRHPEPDRLNIFRERDPKLARDRF
jgi:hypothetical protein